MAVLADLATLAGYTIETLLYEGQRPDLVRLHPRRPSLLVGDGKATEVPTDAATRIRLGAYAAAARAWLRAGVDVHLWICHGPVSQGDWLTCLVSAAESAALLTSSAQSAEFDASTFVSCVHLRRRGGTPGGSGFSTA
ncbi:hypothetical protein ACU610_21315 [Geodermatophilus sp. URMC 61]|uniref:hypothetical protein n=1 Tax=Geodermatophilus sp. URMC 61 TaxID=3423411 RepID=UPI00406C6AEB